MPSRSNAPATTRPVRWLREASPGEIAATLIDLDPEKAVAVVGAIVKIGGPELGARCDRVMEAFKADPARGLARLAGAFLRNV